jgi:hypothetical protein
VSEILLLSNPSRKRKHRRKNKAKRRASSRRRASTRKRRSIRVRARRNPSMRSLTGSIAPTVKAGAIGAIGGLLNDLAYGFGKQYLPGVMQSGVGRHATKILSAVLIGVAGGVVLKGKGAALANGAATVAIHEALKEQLAGMVPSLPLGAMDEAPGLLGYEPGMHVDEMGEYVDAGMGEYVEAGIGEMDDDEG